MSLFAAEETETVAPEAAEVAAAVCPGIARSVRQGGFVREVVIADSDAGFEARVLGGRAGRVVCFRFRFCFCFVSGNGEREAASAAFVGIGIGVASASASGVVRGRGRD